LFAAFEQAVQLAWQGKQLFVPPLYVPAAHVIKFTQVVPDKN
jgi:hypothetical protein